MKNLLLVSLILVQAGTAFAQDCCMADSAVRVFQSPSAGMEAEAAPAPRFYYFNDEWLAVGPDMIQPDSIQSSEIKNDEYGNRAVFCTVSPAYLEELKAELRKSLINLDPRCEFPGGNEKLKEWIDANIRIPEGFRGRERVVVTFRVQPDGTVTDPGIVRASTNEAANEEALRLARTLPKFSVTYFTPRKHSIFFNMPVTFREPGVEFVADSFPQIKAKIEQLYENVVFGTANDSDFNIADICTDGFLRRLANANDSDSDGYATWLLRSGLQDGDDTPSMVRAIYPGAGNKIIVKWTDMGHYGSTTFTMVESDGTWKIDDATVPDGYNPL